jgi:RNA polymerase sigma-70 factor (ECF subfamily)
MEDVTQDVLEEVVKGLRGFQFRSQVSTFIYQIAVRACIARIRERNTRKRIQESDCIPWDDEAAEVDTTSARAVRHPGKDPEEALLHRENIQVMKRALMNLDSRCREILGFRYLQELPCQEIAARLNVKENTLVVQIKRCLLRLVEYYQMEG